MLGIINFFLELSIRDSTTTTTPHASHQKPNCILGVGLNSDHIRIICVITYILLRIIISDLKTIIALFHPFLCINMRSVMPCLIHSHIYFNIYLQIPII